jgi:hypothetical protein
MGYFRSGIQQGDGLDHVCMLKLVSLHNILALFNEAEEQFFGVKYFSSHFCSRIL